MMMQVSVSWYQEKIVAVGVGPDGSPVVVTERTVVFPERRIPLEFPVVPDMASVSPGGTVAVAQGREVWVLSPDGDVEKYPLPGSPIGSISIGQNLVAGRMIPSGEIWVWRRGASPSPLGIRGELVSVSPTEDRVFVVERGGCLSVWNGDRQQITGRSIPCCLIPVMAVCPAGEKIALADVDRVWILEGDRSRDLRLPGVVNTMAWSPDGTRLVIGASGSPLVLLSGEEEHLDRNLWGVQVACFRDNASLLVAMGRSLREFLL